MKVRMAFLSTMRYANSNPEVAPLLVFIWVTLTLIRRKAVLRFKVRVIGEYAVRPHSLY